MGGRNKELENQQQQTFNALFGLGESQAQFQDPIRQLFGPMLTSGLQQQSGSFSPFNRGFGNNLPIYSSGQFNPGFDQFNGFGPGPSQNIFGDSSGQSNDPLAAFKQVFDNSQGEGTGGAPPATNPNVAATLPNGQQPRRVGRQQTAAPDLNKPGGEGTVSQDLMNTIGKGGGSIEDPTGQAQAQQDIIDKNQGTGEAGQNFINESNDSDGTGTGPNKNEGTQQNSGQGQGQQGGNQGGFGQFLQNLIGQNGGMFQSQGVPGIGNIFSQAPGAFQNQLGRLNSGIQDAAISNLQQAGTEPELLQNLFNRQAAAINAGPGSRQFQGSASQQQILDSFAPLAMQANQQAFNQRQGALAGATGAASNLFGQQQGGFNSNLNRAQQLAGFQDQGFRQNMDIFNLNNQNRRQDIFDNLQFRNIGREEALQPLRFAMQALGLGTGGSELTSALQGTNQAIANQPDRLGQFMQLLASGGNAAATAFGGR